jgi:hypothetical protein
VRRREALDDPAQDVALRGGVVPGHEPDEARDPRQRALALRCEEPFRREPLLQPLQRGEVGAGAVALDREHAEPEVAALLEELGPSVDVDTLAVDEVEPKRVERPARHLCGEAGAAVGILEREEHRRPPSLAAQLGHLPLDPHRRQALQPRRDALVEGADGVHPPAVDLRRLDLHPTHLGRQYGRASRRGGPSRRRARERASCPVSSPGR